jgi:ATP-dependent RNA helicase RhlE
MNGGSISLETTEIFVLDEADQMLDLGFIRPLRQIIAKLPPRRQSLFFSATMPHEIGALASELLRNPARVAVTPVAKTADRVSQKVIFVEAPKKRSLLVELFGDGAMRRALIFTRTKRGADKVARHLEGAGIAAAAIHGNKSQGQREAALSAFKASSIRALVATDIAARGIDIDLVTHVINFELPNVPESYVHRIGRTARAGNEGIAISLCDGEERAYLKEIERLIRQTIPSADRRGDATLIATAAAPRSEARRDNAGNGGYRDRYARSMGRLNSGEKVHGPLRPAARVERDRDDRGPTRGAQAEHPHSQHHHPSEKSHRHGNGHRGQNNSHRRGGGHNPTHAPRAAHQGQGEARNGNRDQLHKNSAKAATRAHSDTNGQSGHYSNGHRSGNELRRDRGCRPEVRNESRSRRNDSTN